MTQSMYIDFIERCFPHLVVVQGKVICCELCCVEGLKCNSKFSLLSEKYGIGAFRECARIRNEVLLVFTVHRVQRNDVNSVGAVIF